MGTLYADARFFEVFIVHLGMDDPEGNAITDGWRYRVQELEILQEPEFKRILQEQQIRLFTYRELAKMYNYG
jgi:hypothetical protein